MAERRYRAGDSIEDLCRVCKIDRMHTVIVTDTEGRPLRVSCGYCSSEHNYRGSSSARTASRPGFGGQGSAGNETRAMGSALAKSGRDPFPLVSDRERTVPRVSAQQLGELD